MAETVTIAVVTDGSLAEANAGLIQTADFNFAELQDNPLFKAAIGYLDADLKLVADCYAEWLRGVPADPPPPPLPSEKVEAPNGA